MVVWGGALLPSAVEARCSPGGEPAAQALQGKGSMPQDKCAAKFVVWTRGDGTCRACADNVSLAVLLAAARALSARACGGRA